MWFVKSKRAQTSDDDETWVAGGVVPTLNSFDCGDTRATVVIVMREREGKSGGGKGFLLAENRSFTLATSNFQIIFYGNRVGDIQVQDDKVNTLQARMGTGGNNMPMLAEGKATAFHPTQTPVSGEISPALGTTSQGMGVMAFDSYNQSVSETSQTIRKGQAGNDHVGMVMEKSVVRRLTPTECERLQGFPDGWTDGQADSHRYKQMGNAVAVPVVQWIIDRLVK